MAIKFTNGINLAKTALVNALLHPVATDPTDPADGQVWYNTTTNRVMIRSNAESKELAFSDETAAGAILASDFSANALLVGASDGTPTALTVAPSTVVGRDSAGNVAPLDGDTLRSLLGIEAGATADQDGAEIAAKYEAETGRNQFTDELLAKLEGIADGATGPQTAAEILALLLTVHGSGSSLDADTVDGLEAAAFQTVAGMAPYATTADLDAAIAALVGGAGDAYNTLVELQNELTSNDSQIDTLLADIAGKSRKVAFDVGDDTETTIAVTHGLNTLDCSVYVRSNVTFEMVIADVVHTGPNTIDVIFATKPDVNEYRVIVQG